MSKNESADMIQGSDGPVFIVGMNGSGTTMLADSLGRHPELYIFPMEVRLLPFLIKTATSNGGCLTLEERRRLAYSLGRAKPVWQANGWKNLELPNSELGIPGVAATVDAVFRNFASRSGKSRWGEKSPMNVLHMSFLGEVFSDAKFVHIVRDGRDAAQSFHRRFGFCPGETIYRWKRVTRQATQQGRLLGSSRYLEVRYENVTADPNHSLREICEFLNLRFNTVVLESSMRMANENMAKHAKSIVINSGKWVDYFSTPQVVALEEIAGQRLVELGYPVTTVGDTNPGRLKRIAWRARGVAHRTVKHFSQWGWSGLPGYLRSLLVSAKQAASGRE